MSEPRTETRVRAGFTDTQRIALLEGDMDTIEAKHDKILSRVNWLIAMTFTLALAIFSAVVSVAVVR